MHCIATQPGRDWESRTSTLNAQCDESMDEVTAENGQLIFDRPIHGLSMMYLGRIPTIR
jgi:hypothetical protein